MKKHLYTIVLLSTLLVTCNEKDDDFSGREQLRGRLSYLNIYTGDGQARPLAGKLVKAAYSPSDTLNYITSDSTDADGYFMFENMSGGKLYELFYIDTIGGVRYMAFTKETAPNNIINLVAANDSARQNGMYLETRLNGQPAGNTRICVFNNRDWFNADTCNGSSQSDFSDLNGRKIFYALTPNTYYIRAYKRMGNDLFIAIDSPVLISKTGIPRRTLNLVKVTALNGLTVTVQDKLGLPVSNIKVGIYNNYVTYKADTMVNASMFNGNTVADGSVTFPNLSPVGKYYARARSAIGNVVIAGSDSMGVNATGMSVLPVKVYETH
jgi:hypothetical protein